MNSVITDLSQIPGIGQAYKARLQQIGIYLPIGVLFHLPKTYQDRTQLTPFDQLISGCNHLIQATISSTKISFGKKRMLLCFVIIDEHPLLLRFFHFNKRQMAMLQPGQHLRCFGQIRQGLQSLEMVHPEYKLINEQHPVALDACLTPIYPIVEGISQTKFRSLVKYVLDHCQGDALEDYLPASLSHQFSLAPLKEAVQLLHFPPPTVSVNEINEGHHPYQQRLILDELIAHRLSMRQKRDQHRTIDAPPLALKPALIDQFLDSLPFKLTASQQHVYQQISHDLRQPHAMLRLLQGDVGSGKTVIAMLAILQAVANGYQAAIMAPTEVLAEQHALKFKAWLTPLGIEVCQLSGSMKKSVRKQTEAAIAHGSCKVIVGTQALFQEKITFKNLSLVIIDEQHRFGVNQRQAIKAKGNHGHQEPHQLIMSATPIPRTLAMTLYADLDVSTIEGLPPGRQPITTAIISNDKRTEVIARVKKACEQGQQVYWVCTLIEDSEMLNCENAEDTAKNLQNALPSFNVGLIHGRLKNDEKSRIMTDFNLNKIHILVATTVIEVGVDVPNASIMIIENPERLGLAQIHQLRGRIGRGSTKSYCLLLYHPPLSAAAQERLTIIRDHHDGFKISAYDLKIRGPGEVLGTKQTGQMDFKIANLSRDHHLIDKAQQIADHLFEEHVDSVDKLIKRWIGHNEQYRRV